jgi:hypothetical protein
MELDFGQRATGALLLMIARERRRCAARRAGRKAKRRGRSAVPGVTLSRWTMSYIAAALVALVVAEALMAAGFGHPAASLRGAETLLVVHLVTIGWLSLLMLGALFQFVPVLVARPLHSDRVAGVVLLGLLAGLAALAAGFLRLADMVIVDLPFFQAAAALLGVGFALAIYTLGRTLDAAVSSGLPARFVAVGLVGLAATVMFGVIFAGVLGGGVAATLFLEIAAAGVPLHAAAGIGGWLTFTAMGVSYRLLAMFMLAPELERAGTRWVHRLGIAALGVTVLGGGAAAAAGADLAWVLAAAGLLAAAALVLYGRDVVHLYRHRRRRNLELNSRMAICAFASLAVAAALAAVTAARGTFENHVDAVVFLTAFGWLTGLGLAKLYKIVAFLTWLECYGPVLGKTATPRVQDLVDERRALPWFIAFFLSSWLGAAALLMGSAFLFRLAAAAMLVATFGIVVQFVRTRRLAEVSATLRLPAGACRPRLFLSTPH